jgi:hypothetical protein
MRPLIPTLALTVLSTVAVAAADSRTEVIPLRFVAASDVDRMVFPAEPAGGFGNPGPLPSVRGLGFSEVIPKGVAAWSIDPRTNRITVVGSQEGIREVKNLVRLLDIPPRQVRLTVRQFSTDEALLQKLAELDKAQAPIGVPRPEPLSASILRGELPAALRERVTERVSLTTPNNIPAYVRGEEAGSMRTQIRVVPRVNGDGTVTTFVRLARTEPGDRRPNKVTADLTGLRRLSVGETLLLLTEGSKTGLAVTVEELLNPKSK